ncbi:MAG: DUF4836 family protein [Ginsengibacter sp.]
MKSLLKLSVVAVVILMFSSCGKKNQAGKMVPQNAMVVAQIDLKSLGNKLSWKEIQQTDIYKKMIADSSVNGWKKSLLENPSSSGIDFDAGLTVFTADHDGDKYLAAEGKIKNQNDFDQFNKNFSEGNETTNGDVHILNLKNKGVLGWKNNQFIYLMNHDEKIMEMDHWNDSMSQQNPMSSADRTAEFTALCKNLFSLKTDSSLANNDRFSSLLKENGDIHVYQNTDAMLNNAPQMGPLSMLKLDAFMKGNASTYTINFDNGKIDVSQKMFVSKQLTDIVKKYMGNSIDMDMVKRIPSNNLLGLMAFNFKPEGVTEMIKLTGMDGMINSYTQPMGFNLDDFSKATNGNWLLAFTDLDISDSMRHPDFNYIFSAGINDKAELEKMLNAAKKTTAEMGKDSVLNYVMNDKLFAQSNHSSFANQYVNGNSNTSFDFANKISGHPAAFYFDIHKLLSQFTSWNTTKPGRKEMLNESLKIWNNIISTGGEFNNGGFTFNTEVNLENKDSNSLQQLKNYFNSLFLIHEKTKAEVPDVKKRLDSLLTPPPVDTVR